MSHEVTKYHGALNQIWERLVSFIGYQPLPFKLTDLIITRLSTAERDALEHAHEGMVIWNTTTEELNVYKNNSWTAVASAELIAPVIINTTALAAGGTIFDTGNLKLFKAGGTFINPISGPHVVPKDVLEFRDGLRIKGDPTTGEIRSVGDYDLIIRVEQSREIEGADFHCFGGQGKAFSDGSFGRGGNFFGRGGEAADDQITLASLNMTTAGCANLNTVFEGRMPDTYRYVELNGGGTDGNRLRLRTVADAPTSTPTLTWDVGAPTNPNVVIGGYDITLHFRPNETTVAQVEALFATVSPDSPNQMIKVKVAGTGSNVLTNADVIGFSNFTGGAEGAVGGIAVLDSAFHGAAQALGDVRIGTARSRTTVMGRLDNLYTHIRGKTIYVDFATNGSFAIRAVSASANNSILYGSNDGINLSSVGFGSQQLALIGNGGSRFDAGTFVGTKRTSGIGDGAAVTGHRTHISGASGYGNAGSAIEQHQNGDGVGPRLFTGMASGSNDALCWGEALTASAAITAGMVVVWSGSKKVAQATAVANLTTIAGVAMTAAAGDGVEIRAARRGRCYVQADAGITAGQLVGTSGTNAGKVAASTPGAGAIIGRACEATGGTIAGYVLVDLVLG
jgi:hypothetical protein